MQTGAQVADHTVQEILQRIDTLATKIGTTAAHIWDVYVQQARVEAIRDTAFAVIFGVLSVALAYLAFRLFKYGLKSDYDVWPYVCGSLSAIAAVVLFLASGSFGYSSIGEWLNPQYWAFQHLMQDLKNLL